MSSRTTRFSMSSTDVNSPLGRMLKRCPPSVIRPVTHREVAAFQRFEISNANAMRGHTIRIEQYSDLARRHAVELDAGNALKSLDSPLQESVQHVVAVRQIAIARNAELQDGLITE